MLIVLSLYFLVVWLVFIKFQWLPWNRAWKTVVFSIAAFVALVVVGALQYYTPGSRSAVVQGHTQYIFPLVSGQVVAVSVERTATVEAGEELFRLDPEPFQNALAARAADLKLAEIRLRDTRILVEKNAAPAAGLYRYEGERDLAQALFDQAQYELDHSVVRAPTAGTISMAQLYVGEVVRALTPVLNFSHAGKIRIAAAFPQNGMERIAKGKRATVVFSAAPGEIYETSVAAVAPTVVQGQMMVQNVADPLAALTSLSGLYAVLIDFPEDAPVHLRRPGTEASVTVFTDEGNPVNVLANILQWISAWLAYI